MDTRIADLEARVKALEKALKKGSTGEEKRTDAPKPAAKKGKGK